MGRTRSREHCISPVGASQACTGKRKAYYVQGARAFEIYPDYAGLGRPELWIRDQAHKFADTCLGTQA